MFLDMMEASTPGQQSDRDSAGAASVVVFYEEPTLRNKFGTAYDEYCRNVGRWLPRVRAWNRPR